MPITRNTSSKGTPTRGVTTVARMLTRNSNAANRIRLLDGSDVMADKFKHATCVRVHRQGSHSRVLGQAVILAREIPGRSEAHTSELQSLMRISYPVFCLN